MTKNCDIAIIAAFLTGVILGIVFLCLLSVCMYLKRERQLKQETVTAEEWMDIQYQPTNLSDQLSTSGSPEYLPSRAP